MTAYVLRSDGAGADTLGRAEYPVGQPPTTTGPDAVRFGKLVWHTYGGGSPLATDPVASTGRVNENWAQAAVAFTHAVAPDFDPATARNVLRLNFENGGAVSQSGGSVMVTLSTPAGSCTVAEAYLAGWTLEQVAQVMASKTNLGLCPSSFDSYGFSGDRGAYPAEWSSAKLYYVVFGRGVEVRVVSEVATGQLQVRQAAPDFAQLPSRSNAVSVAAAAFHDGDPATVDVFSMPTAVVTRAAGPDTQAFARDDGQAPPNVVVAREEVVRMTVRRPTVIGHEVGHVLLVGPFPGSVDTGTGNHSSHDYHLMYKAADAPDAKRLTPAQHLAARCESGPPADVAGVQCPATDPVRPSSPALLTTHRR